MASIIIIFILLAIAIFALVSGARERGEEARVLRKRLAGIAHRGPHDAHAEVELLREDVASTVPGFNKLLSRWVGASQLQKWIHQSGLHLLVGKFVLMAACLGGITCVLVQRFTGFALLAIVAFPVGGGVPALLVAAKRHRRFDAFEAMLPNAIDLLARAVRAGHAFTTALELISTEMPEPLCGEFRKVFEQQKFGMPLRDALLNLTERMPLLDVRILVTAILLQRETGGNLAEILDKLSYVMRERFKILRQVRVYTAQGRISMAILIALPFALAAFMSFTAPDSLQVLYTDPLGKRMIAGGILSLSLGYLTIRKIIRIRV
jgi:tight adherence protein B